jgi:S-sulfo-L-cysteine synthase (O-acetyl-L-serine-dependent)
MILEQIIGNTPLVEVRHMNPKRSVRIYCKLEGQNPGGSVKDRAAYGMISMALERGTVKPGDKLVEATSGNTGIALAMIAKLTGLRCTSSCPTTAPGSGF